MKQNLKVMFLGGVSEIGKNMTLLEYGNDIIVIDAGLSFPNDEMLGIDLVIPDFTYLEQNKERVRGIFITHGHEDHIGAIPFILKKMDLPVYGTKLTLALIENKLVEHKISSSTLFAVKPGSVIEAGCFSVEFINTTHSISGCCALAVRTPVGVVFHTGDFKVDYTPINGDVMNFKRIAELGGKGVLLMLCESTNVEREGSSISERNVGDTLDNILRDNLDRRIIVATFASNIHRIQQIVNLAVKYNRKVTFSGRSMVNIAENAKKIGELNINVDSIVPLDKVKNVEDKNLVILCTGSQGEPMSALTRMSNDEFPSIKVGKNDTIIVSASPIPGNEKMVYNVINNLYRKGARVIYSMLADVHVSGHAFVEELKLMHKLVNPKFFIPVHGEYRHLKQHQELAMKLGMDEKDIIIPEIGSVVEVSRSRIVQKGTVPAGMVLVDGSGVGDVGSVVLRDRKHLAEDGLVIVSLGFNFTTNTVITEPEIITRGFIFVQQGDNIIEKSKLVVLDAITRLDKSEMVQDKMKKQIQKSLKNFFYKRTKRSPIIIPIITEIE